MLSPGEKVRLRKEALASYYPEFRARVDETRVAVVEKVEPHHGAAFLVYPPVGRKREFRAGWFDPKLLDIVAP